MLKSFHAAAALVVFLGLLLGACGSSPIANVARPVKFNAPATVPVDMPYSLSLSDSADETSTDFMKGFSYAFDCGTGYGEWGTASSTTCVGVSVAGHRTVNGRIRDNDGGISEYTATVEIVAVPLTDLGTETYLGFEGGLYPGGSNSIPADHAAVLSSALADVVPRNTAGTPSPAGKIVLISLGMSNNEQEWGGPNSKLASGKFMPRARNDPAVNQSTLSIMKGADGAQVATTWDDPTDYNYDRVRDEVLAPEGLTEAQVQVVWLKTVHTTYPQVSLPAANADAYQFEASMGRIVRALRVRWPNVKLVFVSSRTYGGYATTDLHPEPFAYETGFAVKWLIEAQIAQERTNMIDAQAGDLSPLVAPGLLWGPYLWASGPHPRSDGLVWLRTDFQADGIHPSPSGESKVGLMLLDFFKNSPLAEPWFLEPWD